MSEDAIETKTLDELTTEEVEQFLGVQQEGILKVTATEWKDDWSKGVTDNAERWKKRTTGTKKDIVGLAIAAEPKYAEKTKKAIELGSRAKALARTNTAEVIAQVQATPASAYSDGATLRANKFGRRIDAQYPLREYAVKRMNAMKEGTDAEREKKMIASKRCNVIIGQALKGIIDIGTARTQIDKETT